MSRSIGLSEEVEAYVRKANRDEHPVLARCREETQATADIPAMQISPEQGSYMALMAQIMNAKTYVEVGVFTGYSALAMALAMKAMHGQDARIIACDLSAEFLEKARGYWKEAGVDALIESRDGPAEETLKTLPDGDVDMMFVDADKTGYPVYFEHSARLLRSGGLVMFDNVLWSGSVADEDKSDENTKALREVARLARNDQRFDIAFTAIGDGLLLCRKK